MTVAQWGFCEIICRVITQLTLQIVLKRKIGQPKVDNHWLIFAYVGKHVTSKVTFNGKTNHLGVSANR